MLSLHFIADYSLYFLASFAICILLLLVMEIDIVFYCFAFLVSMGMYIISFGILSFSILSFMPGIIIRIMPREYISYLKRDAERFYYQFALPDGYWARLLFASIGAIIIVFLQLANIGK